MLRSLESWHILFVASTFLYYSTCTTVSQLASAGTCKQENKQERKYSSRNSVLKYRTHSACAGYKDNLGFYTNFLESGPAKQEKKDSKKCMLPVFTIVPWGE